MMQSSKDSLRFGVIGLAAVVWMTLARSAHAQSQPGFAVGSFEPSERGSDWFAGESLDLRGKVRPAFGVVGDYSYRPLVVRSGNTIFAEPLKDQMLVHLGGGVVLYDRLRLSLDLPIQVYADGTSAPIGAFAGPAHSQGVGDLRVAGDVRLFGTYGGPATAAIGVQVWAPTGSRDQYTSDGSVRLRPRAMIAGDVGILAYAVQLSVGVRTRSEEISGNKLGTDLGGVASLGVRVANRRLLVGPEVLASTVLDDLFAKRTTPVEALLGAHYAFDDGLRLGAGVGTGLASGIGAPQFRALLSVEWMAPFSQAKPPPPHAPAPPPRAPAPPPVVVPQGDRDHDGIVDRDDACPDVPGVPSTDPKKNGCPPDTDGDGINDIEDACPKTPGIRTNNPATNGCPDPDRDKDGIPNVDDACPDEPGPRDPDPARSGCPKAFVKGSEIKILDQVTFKTGSKEIMPGKANEDVLQGVLSVLKTHPKIAKVEVQGYTDNVGRAAVNKKLSADRAASVVAWLVAHGAAASRLSSRGFGSEKPVDSNQTEGGRRNNRRIEFHIVK
ncbi:MAG: OmpA family protein [Polyangiaceae bacterium]|nr:OmpA family protein [Polyangiaceae bacterium]